jgi:hypothetical protein
MIIYDCLCCFCVSALIDKYQLDNKESEEVKELEKRVYTLTTTEELDCFKENEDLAINTAKPVEESSKENKTNSKTVKKTKTNSKTVKKTKNKK